MAERRAEHPERDASNTGRDPDEWQTGAETPSDEAAESAEGELTKAQASKRIDTPREEAGRSGERGRSPLARQVAEHDVQARVADSLERIAASLEKIIQILGRPADQRRERPRDDFRRRDRDAQPRRDYGYPDREGNRYQGEGNRYQGGNRYQEGRGRPGRPGRRWGRDDTPR